MYCTRLRAHHQPPGSPGRPKRGDFDGGPLACTSHAPQALEKMGCGCGQHQHLSTRTRELRAGCGLVSWMAAATAAAAAAAVLAASWSGCCSAAAAPVSCGCWLLVRCGRCLCLCCLYCCCLCCLCLCCLCCLCLCCCLSFFLLPLLLPAAAPSLPLPLLLLCFPAVAADVVLLVGRKGSQSANRQQCPRTVALLGFWRFVSARLGPKRQEGK